MDTHHLRHFLKVADTGSISRAAVSLGITQPSLSQQVLRLEDEVGFKLFRRTARGVALTEAGRIFQEHARHILRSSEQAFEDVRQLDEQAAGTVIVAVPYSISKLAGVALVDSMKRHAPRLRFRLVEAFTGQIRGWLDSAKIDLGILHELGPLRHLSARRLATEELFVVGPAGRFGSLDAPASVPPAQLGSLPMILPGLPHGMRQLIEQQAARRGLSLRVKHDIDAMMHIGRLIAHGHGYSILPLPAIAEDLAAGRVSIARIGDEPLTRTLCLVRNASQMVTHASVRCEDLLVEVLARLIESGAWVARSELNAASEPE